MGKHARKTAVHATPKNTVNSFDDPYKDYGSTVRAVFALIIAGVIFLFLMKSCVSAIEESNTSSTSSSEKNEQVEEFIKPLLLNKEELFESTPEALDKIPESPALQTFSLTNTPTDSLSREEREAIQNKLSEIEQTASVGFVFYNTQTGKGISYNPDESIYGASTYKAPYALYVCEEHIETGKIALPTSQDVPYYGQGALTEALIENAIIYSDNDSYGTLRTLYDTEEYDDWIATLGTPDTAILPDSWFPWYCARSSAKLWTEMNNYFETESETAQWLNSLCAQTNLSFLRNGLSSYEGVQVLNKGGWCTGEDYAHDYNSVSDAGIVSFDGQTYIMSVMTGLPDSSQNEELATSLIAALFDAHATLDT